MNLSPHFTLEELTTTQQRMDNTPDKEALDNMTESLAPLLERVRTLLGYPLHINSGYRSPAVNKAVGGSVKSAHMSGFAADFICPGFGTPLQIVRKIDASGLYFDQLIQEGNWVHISADPMLRREVLTAHFGPNGTTYTAGA